MRSLIIILSVFIPSLCWSINYTTPENPWPEKYGNHRAVLNISENTEAAHLNLEWRRHDNAPDQKQFLIIHVESGEVIENIHRIKVNNEVCELSFGPVKKTGKYYFYYLPYEVQLGYGFYNKGYSKPEKPASKKWLSSISEKPSVEAEVLAIESRSAFDSFYPMEVIALEQEKKALVQREKQDYLVFPEDRKYPIRMQDNIPERWVKRGPQKEFQGTALRHEYYAFQLGVWAAKTDLEDVKVSFSDLVGPGKIAADQLTCFNTGGTDPYGKTFVKRVDVANGQVQPLWIGVDIPENIAAGKYEGKVTVEASNSKATTIDISLMIKDEVIAERGDNEPWRHSRLRWLNSTLGIDDEPTEPYNPIQKQKKNKYEFTGKTLTYGDQGLPSSIEVKGVELLADPIRFKVKTSNGTVDFTTGAKVEQVKLSSGIVTERWTNNSEAFKLQGERTLEADGYLNFKLKLTPLKDVEAKNIQLEIPFKSDIAKYMKGMDLPGSLVPEKHDAKWKGPHDSYWIGNNNGGLWCEFRGTTYHGPMLNLFHPEYPASWHNDGNGGFKIEKQGQTTKAITYSGQRSLQKDEEIVFEWSMLVTPVKEINYKSQFLDRYYHNGGDPMPAKEDFDAGVEIVNLHHANEYNPNINYPFIAVDEMRGFVDKIHEKGKKVKIYYTVRELTNYTTELWALRSLGHEILGDGAGGGYPWLREHLVGDYRPQWYQHLGDQSADASIVNAYGDSRWYNYYIEGLAWLVKHVGIDGLYLDDVSYDRRTLKRIRKVLDRAKPGCLLDLHSNTGFSKGPATQYAEFFPYLDKLWFGESFQYSKMPPENWFVEVSGIPFGLMGDMLHAGGNRWLGMLFGMTVRHPWHTEGVTCDPRPVWKVWDSFKIQDADMIGFWENNTPVTTSSEVVYATCYVKNGETLIAIGNFSDKEEKVKLNIDFKQLGLKKGKVTLSAPYVENYQEEQTWNSDETITVPARKGFLILVK